MSYKAICEIILYIQSFKNVQLADQGVYFIKASIRKDNVNGEPIFASGTHKFELNKQLRCRKKNKIRQESEILDTQYKTKSFAVRYNQQQIDLEEVVVLRMQLDTFPVLDSQNVFIYFDLYYSMDSLFSGLNDLQFKKLTTLKAKLNNIEEGICDFSSLSFQQKYNSLLNIYIFSILLDYKFRKYKSLSHQKSSFEIKRQSIQNLNQYYSILFAQLGRNSNQFYDLYVKAYKNLSGFAKKNWIKAFNNKTQIVYKIAKSIIQPGSDNKQQVQVSQKEYFNYMNNYKIEQFNLQKIQEYMQTICIENYNIYQLMQKQIQNNNLNKEYLKSKFIDQMRQRCGEFIFKITVKPQDLVNDKYSGKQKKNIAQKIRNKEYYQQLEAHNIQNLNFFPNLKQQPVLFYQVTDLKSPSKSKYKNILFVFSHGFQGSWYDMVSIKNNIKFFYPKANFLNSRCNEGNTQGDIFKMGNRLADQIIQFIHDQQIEQDLVIHMVGHSLGGLILRASLKKLEKYKRSFGTFLTFSSPHLGYLNGTKTSIGAGLWFIKKWKEILSLEQMAMTDNSKMQQTALYKLSEIGHLKNFRNIVVLSSYEDAYVPWHSARIHNFKQSAKNNRGIVQNKMINNILGDQFEKQNKIQKIHRIDVSFEIKQKNIDSMIGRTAHIKFLVDETVLKMILFCAPDLFE